jgi:hypothetical protein
MRRKAAFAAAAFTGAALGAFLSRTRRRGTIASLEPGQRDTRADELRRKLAEARTASAQEDDFEAAGMGAETIVDEAPRRPVPPGPPPPPPARSDRTEGEEFEMMRRRIHEEGRAAAEEMRRGGEPPVSS